MKKLLAILLSVMMLLSVCAAAEGRSVTLENVQLMENDVMMFDLSGMKMTLAGVNGENGAGLRVALDCGEDPADELTLWLGETALAVKASFLSDVYALELGAMAGQLRESLSVEALTGQTGQSSSADVAAARALVAAAKEAYAAGVTDAGTVEIDGASYAATNVEISEAECGKILDALFALLENHPELLKNSDVSSFGELRNAVQPALSISGKVYKGDAGKRAELTATLSVAGQPEPVVMGLNVNRVNGAAEGENQNHVELSVNATQESIGMKLDAALRNDDGAWIPAEIGNAQNLMAAMNDSTVQQKLIGEASAFAMRLLSNVTYILQQNGSQGLN